jgi:hypothetical protein
VLGVHHSFKKISETKREVVLDMTAYAQQALDMYHAVPNAPALKANVHYPWYEPTQAEIAELSSKPGIFSHCAASLLMKLLYAGRMVRLDLCYSINALSRYVTKWNALCDKQMTHLFSYLLMSKGTCLHAYTDSNDIDSVELHAYPDADLAGSYDSTKATSGGFIHLHGENTFFPLDWYSKRQGATSHSTTEAELISASKMLRESLVPLISLWELMLDRSMLSTLWEDNMSTITVIAKGYSPQLRHLDKHHRISLGIVHEWCQRKGLGVKHKPSAEQKGDMMTKGLARPKHEPACRMVGLYPFLISCVWDPECESDSSYVLSVLHRDDGDG